MTAPRQTATEMAEAAQAWLGSTMRSGRPRVGRPGRRRQRGRTRRWFYTPTITAGSPSHQQRPAQQRAAMRWSRPGFPWPGTSRSPRSWGSRTCWTGVEGFAARFDRERGRDPGMYYLQGFGARATPAPGATGSAATTYRSTTSWSTASWSPTPCFMGADPAVSPLSAARATGRSPGPRTWPASSCGRSRPSSAASGAAAEGAIRSRHRQPRRHQRRGPGDPARGIWRAGVPTPPSRTSSRRRATPSITRRGTPTRTTR